MPRPIMAASLRHSAPHRLRGLRLRGMRMFTGRNKIMAWSCLLFLIGTAVWLLASASSSSSSVDTGSDSLLIWSTDALQTPPTTTTIPTAIARSPLPTEPIEICFISSIYAKSAAVADKPSNINNFLLATQNATANTFAFFLYTNLPDLKAPGWHKIIKRDLNYRRYITRSRWGKFMGWKDPELQGCQTIFYFDGHYEPNQIQHPYAFLDMAADIRRSDVGLAQVRHYDPDRTPLQEFEAILRFQKDIPKNVEASVKWFQAQPDFFNNCTLYANYYFGYDPTNELFQQATEFFWNHYSKEEDSWRDQPLWCYTLEHYHMKPLTMLPLFVEDEDRMGHKGHFYDASQDNDAAATVVAP